MNSRVRIVKRERHESLNDFQASQKEKTDQQTVREIVSIVKGWVAESQQRKRAGEHMFRLHKVL
jgi:hypothetical protein